MLYHLFYSFASDVKIFNVFKYITFRVFLSGLTAFLICLFLAPWFIRKMNKSQIKQVVRDDGPQTHLKKSGTPTMGGGLIIVSIAVTNLLWSDLSNPYIWMLLFVMVFFGLIGWIDDILKISKANPKGIGSRNKITLQFLGAVFFAIFLLLFTEQDFTLRVPFFKNLGFSLWYLFIPFIILVVVGASNAVNLTDGLDGLAIGPIIITSFTFLILSYCSGNFVIAEYLQIPYVRGTGEIAVFCGAMVMAGLGFLWFNSYPAQVFMGDVGALSLGATLGAIAVFTKNEILLVVIGGVFVLEAISVMVQVVSFKMTGKRVFRMAPLHHHFELKGWAEPKVIVRFWIVSIVLAILSLATLKLR